VYFIANKVITILCYIGQPQKFWREGEGKEELYIMLYYDTKIFIFYLNNHSICGKTLAHIKKIFAPLLPPWKKILVPCLIYYTYKAITPLRLFSSLKQNRK